MRLDPELLLLESHGFLVDALHDEPVGVVDEVVVDQEGRPEALVVAAGWFGRRRFIVPVEDVDEIDPRGRRVRLRRRGVAIDPERGRH